MLGYRHLLSRQRRRQNNKRIIAEANTLNIVEPKVAYLHMNLRLLFIQTSVVAPFMGCSRRGVPFNATPGKAVNNDGDKDNTETGFNAQRHIDRLHRGNNALPETFGTDQRCKNGHGHSKHNAVIYTHNDVGNS